MGPDPYALLVVPDISKTQLLNRHKNAAKYDYFRVYRSVFVIKDAMFGGRPYVTNLFTVLC